MMQELEKIIEKMKEIKDGNRKEKLYAKYPPNSKDQEVLNAYSQGYEDGADNFYNAVEEIIRKHLTDGWVPVDDRLPEEEVSVLAQWEKYDKYLNVKLIYLDVMWLDDAEKKVFETINGVPNGKVIAWRPLPEPYQPERSDNHDEDIL